MKVVSNEDVVSSSLITLHGDNIEESDKQDIVTNIEFEATVPSIKKYFFCQRIIDFVNKLEFSDQTYKTNGNVRGGHYKGNLLFYMKDFMSIGTDCQPMYFMSTIFLKDIIDGVHVPQFQFSYIRNKTHTSH